MEARSLHSGGTLCIWEACVCIAEAHGVRGFPPSFNCSKKGLQEMVKLNFFKATKLKGDSYFDQFSYTGSYLYFFLAILIKFCILASFATSYGCQ